MAAAIAVGVAPGQWCRGHELRRQVLAQDRLIDIAERDVFLRKVAQGAFVGPAVVAHLDDETVYKLARGNAIRMLRLPLD